MNALNRIHKILLIFTIAFFTGIVGYGQNMLQGEPTQELKEMAEEKTDMWMEELALTSKQADLMENKIIEFAIKRERLLQSKMPEEAKTERLLALQELESRDMRDILTKPQFETYLAVKRQNTQEQKEGNQG